MRKWIHLVEMTFNYDLERAVVLRRCILSITYSQRPVYQSVIIFISWAYQYLERPQSYTSISPAAILKEKWPIVIHWACLVLSIPFVNAITQQHLGQGLLTWITCSSVKSVSYSCNIVSHDGLFTMATIQSHSDHYNCHS